MVRHVHDGRTYWTLPDGAVELGESRERAIAREVLEETGLVTTAGRILYEEGMETCYVMNWDGKGQANLGYDPEESHLSSKERILQGVGWHSLDALCGDIQVKRVLAALSVGPET